MGDDLEVPELVGDSVGAPVELPVDEQPDPDTGSDRDEHGVLLAGCGAEAVRVHHRRPKIRTAHVDTDGEYGRLLARPGHCATSTQVPLSTDAAMAARIWALRRASVRVAPCAAPCSIDARKWWASMTLRSS